MPRIDAPTVGEHRDAKRRALLDAARSMLSEAPGAPPDINELTARAGMTRSNFYTYFPSRAELVVAVAEDLMPRWITTVAEAVRDAGGGRRGVVAYVHTTLDLVAAGDHQAPPKGAHGPHATALRPRSRFSRELYPSAPLPPPPAVSVRSKWAVSSCS